MSHICFSMTYTSDDQKHPDPEGNTECIRTCIVLTSSSDIRGEKGGATTLIEATSKGEIHMARTGNVCIVECVVRNIKVDPK